MSAATPTGRSRLDGRIALVTGAARGIGEAVARTLAGLGAEVAATDLLTDGIEELADDTARQARTPGGEGTGRVHAYPLDVTDRTAVDLTVARVERELGPVDILVNVAGILRTAPAAELTDEDWARTFAVNATGVFHTTRALVASMAGRGGGSIVTVASNAAGIPRSHMAAYAASKAASVMFTKCVGLEYAGSGVRCNSVCPGSTDTPMQRALWTDADAPRRVIEGDLASYRTGIPLGRIADPQDIADSVAFLCSDLARHITMQDLYVDGGATLR
ncbi:2,3-dihydro-2,3-dihydroxybenzoate dehydrogenase [Streptomyces sp. NPDC054904]|uniref:2,3-dihydro-2,3-dihydroxybenzoate dehydrogenase n=1 Tax=unclassified Streptomyces TaxID=2593676 RepID=UPI002481A4EC|nr:MULTISPECIES: 2,3-dihydro-2,3-dihydroxybenzoate dehydrogenase [unclassified Streptomyces]MDA5285575.1 2,3-dihydro-2,3-dihydroxybenzoate dehydrogenase [Streptomyces sp. Isolate_45]MDX2388613.1 2,3-dihydro-2,3-dihydroxybenzoate dehydrogenase [Streptomyces sp. DK15]